MGVVSPEKKEDPVERLENSLSQEERDQVDAFVEKIDLSNSQAVLNYGSATQKKMASFSESALANVRSKDMDEIGEMINTLVLDLKNFDVDAEDGGIKGFFRKKKNKLEMMKARYSKIETNVNQIQKELENRQVQLMKDSAVLDRMYKVNFSYFKELTMYIAAGRKKLENVRSGELARLQAVANQTGRPEDAQAAKDLADRCESFDKKLHDLELTRTISLQTAPQIRMVQASDNVMAEKIQSTIVNTIPLWKNQMVIALGVQHSMEAAKAQRQVTDMTNELLRKNADSLKTATVETARESERGIVEIDTLKHTNEALISTLDEVIAIQKEGREKRAAAEAELGGIEEQLKAKLIEVSMSQNAQQ
nr:toxic anion resistance protein [Baileyella intestinalis]